jgi:hypothetical protein
MAAKMYYDNDADLALIRAKKVAIIGYGSQGHAHALNLKDSGVKVQVGLSLTSKSKSKAEGHGLTVTTPAEAAKWADVVMVLVPDTTAPAVYKDIEPNMTKGKMLMFAHGFNIRFDTVKPSPDTVAAAFSTGKSRGCSYGLATETRIMADFTGEGISCVSTDCILQFRICTRRLFDGKRMMECERSNSCVRWSRRDCASRTADSWYCDSGGAFRSPRPVLVLSAPLCPV